MTTITPGVVTNVNQGGLVTQTPVQVTNTAGYGGYGAVGGYGAGYPVGGVGYSQVATSSYGAVGGYGAGYPVGGVGVGGYGVGVGGYGVGGVTQTPGVVSNVSPNGLVTQTPVVVTNTTGVGAVGAVGAVGYGVQTQVIPAPPIPASTSRI